MRPIFCWILSLDTIGLLGFVLGLEPECWCGLDLFMLEGRFLFSVICYWTKGLVWIFVERSNDFAMALYNFDGITSVFISFVLPQNWILFLHLLIFFFIFFPFCHCPICLLFIYLNLALVFLWRKESFFFSFRHNASNIRFDPLLRLYLFFVAFFHCLWEEAKEKGSSFSFFLSSFIFFLPFSMVEKKKKDWREGGDAFSFVFDAFIILVLFWS